MAKLSLSDLLAVQREQDKNLYQVKVGDITDLVDGSSAIISPDPPYYFDAYGNEFGERPVDGQLWYDSSEDALTLYVWLEDSGTWVPAAPPVSLDTQAIEDSLFSLEKDVYESNVAIRQNENLISRIVEFSDTAPTTYPDEIINQNIIGIDGETVIRVETTYVPNDLNHKFWFNTSTNELNILRLSDPDARTYRYEVVSSTGGDIYFGDNAPDEDENYELWYHTGDLELLVYLGGMWFPCTPNSGFEVPTLQQVLEAGPPVALKDIYLTNAENDLIDLSVTEGRVVVGTVGEELSPKYELRHKNEEYNSVAIFEIDENGTRLDIEAHGRINNMHFRFNNDDKLILNKSGDVEFKGKIKIEGSARNKPLLLVQPTEARTTDVLFSVNDDSGDNIFEILNNGQVFVERTPLADAEVANKEYVDTKFGNMMPIGAIIFWGGQKERIPDDWVECRGQTAPTSVQAITGLTNIPDLKNYMPAGAGGVFGSTLGSTVDSKFKSHNHSVSRKEPGNTTGNPDGSADSSTSRTRYWRGNDANSGISGANISRATTAVGDDITAPPVYLGVYIMKVN